MLVGVNSPFPQRLAACLALVLCAAPAHGEGPEGALTLPPVGAHWVWVTDQLFTHSRLFDGDSGEVLAMVDGGTTLSPKPPLHSAARGEFYSVEIDYARGKRGARSDYVTIYDAEPLLVEPL